MRMNFPAEVDERQDARARELDAIGFRRLATRVRSCGTRAFFPGFPQTVACKTRICPRCAERIAARNARRVVSAVRRFDRPIAYLATMPSMWNLSKSLFGFREGLAHLRRRACFRTVAGGVSAIETKVADDGMQWQVHAHLVLDDGGLDLAAVAKAWAKFTTIFATNWHGGFELHRDPKIDLRNVNGLAAYICKLDTWCPAPNPNDADSLRRLETLFNALRYRRLLIAWGKAARPSNHEVLDEQTNPGNSANRRG
ncbi:MAG: hypothetical protein HY897_02585 [Deltaproteobacteria bacterium]|nr:hypothetical protein [Deltaproteobacteria bacterium]